VFFLCFCCICLCRELKRNISGFPRSVSLFQRGALAELSRHVITANRKALRIPHLRHDPHSILRTGRSPRSLGVFARSLELADASKVGGSNPSRNNSNFSFFFFNISACHLIYAIIKILFIINIWFFGFWFRSLSLLKIVLMLSYISFVDLVT